MKNIAKWRTEFKCGVVKKLCLKACKYTKINFHKGNFQIKNRDFHWFRTCVQYDSIFIQKESKLLLRVAFIHPGESLESGQMNYSISFSTIPTCQAYFSLRIYPKMFESRFCKSPDYKIETEENKWQRKTVELDF